MVDTKQDTHIGRMQLSLITNYVMHDVLVIRATGCSTDTPGDMARMLLLAKVVFCHDTG